MRLGLGGRGPQPHALVGYGLIAAGALGLLLALPLPVWAAAGSGFLVYLGVSVLRGSAR